jgi:hypothetical protein
VPYLLHWLLTVLPLPQALELADVVLAKDIQAEIRQIRQKVGYVLRGHLSMNDTYPYNYNRTKR